MSETKQEITSRIVDWMKSNLPKDGVEITSDTRINDQNLYDSMELLRLVTFLEEGFAVSIDPELLVPENFTSPAKVAELVLTSKGG